MNLRHWSLLTLFCAVIPPTDKLVRKYLRAHLHKCSYDYVTEEGKYARYAQRYVVLAAMANFTVVTVTMETVGPELGKGSHGNTSVLELYP